MCNEWCLEFASNAASFIRKSKKTLEVGSRNVNGSIRDVLSESTNEYVGVDLFAGPGVDIVCDVLELTSNFGYSSFDVVVSTEMLEHCRNWQDALYQMTSVLCQDGLLLITTRSPGFELHDYPADHWRFSYNDFKEIFQPLGEIIAIQSDMTLSWPCGIGILVKKKLDQPQLSKWKLWLDTFDIYSMENEIALSKNAVEPKPKDMIFDQYSRYKACSDLLRQTNFALGNSILDIGSGPERLFGQFMPDATMNYVDPLIPSGSGQGHISGTIFTKELDGQMFDCVSAVDVLEHVPPEYRQPFLERMSALGKSALILGFPAADATDALETDRDIDNQYRAIFGHDYSWLEEHYRFGLPSLAETVEYLTSLGWHCQTVGHGHTPWLKELLGFVVCAWDAPGMSDVVLRISEKFNCELYAYDFCPPYYRQFVIASRNPLPGISAPATGNNIEAAEHAFRALLEDARQHYFAASIRQLVERDAHIVELNRKIEEVSEWGTTVQTRVVERDACIAALNLKIEEVSTWGVSLQAALVERDEQIVMINNSLSWRITRPLRFLARWVRYGLTGEDRQQLSQRLRYYYHRLSLPVPAKRVFSFIYHKVVGNVIRTLRRSVALPVSRFHAPAVKPAVKIKGLPDYIVWGVIDWHFRHQRPQQLALALADTGRRVFYVSPNLVDDERTGFEVEALDASGLLFQIKVFAKGSPIIYSAVPTLDVVSQLRACMGDVLNWADCHRLVSMVQHPFWYDVASVLPNSRLVYDCMDHHEGFGNTGETLVQLEKALFGNADLTITTSAWLDFAIAEHTPQRVLIRNAAEYAYFSVAPEKIYRDPKGRLIIGYYGAIAEWFDLDLVEAVAKHHPDCCVLLIGADSINAESRLGKFPNVAFTGEVPYSQLPYYLYGFDVCLLPFKVVPLTLATNPVKVYEYLSAGKPVISVDLPEMAQFDSLVYVAADQAQFLAAVDTVLSRPEPEASILKRKVFAEGQTWKHRAEALIQHAESTVGDPKVSIIVVTYNNLELTQACLASIDEYSHYDNLEIIVVDNASSDGSPAFLENWVSGDDKRKLILNSDNRGFAAANNQGLAIATGDFLVLLNNDTHVTPGWLRTLTGHLKRDKTIGLIGPVTNNIGNEAKIDIAYADMDEMLVKSAAYTRRHIAQLYPLRTAAFFCVMIRRDVFERVGPLDEAFGRGFFEDDDYCRRIEKLGLRIVCGDDVFIHHQLSASFDKLKVEERQMLFDDNKKIYEAKWGAWFPHSYRMSE